MIIDARIILACAHFECSLAQIRPIIHEVIVLPFCVVIQALVAQPVGGRYCKRAVPDRQGRRAWPCIEKVLLSATPLLSGEEHHHVIWVAPLKGPSHKICNFFLLLNAV
jgi:hypothetical protein